MNARKELYETLKKRPKKFAGDDKEPEKSEVGFPREINLDPNAPMPAIPSNLKQTTSDEPTVADINPINKIPAIAPLSADTGAPNMPQTQAPPEAQPAATNVDLGTAKPTGQQPTFNPQLGVDLTAGLEEQKAGNLAEAAARGAESQETFRALKDHATQLKGIQDQANVLYQKQANEINSWIHDQKEGHIDPKHYVNNLSGSEKVSMGIGLLLGGMGQGLIGGKNPALEMLHRNIDADVAAQKYNYETGVAKQKNIYSAMLAQHGNQKDALDATRMFYLSDLKNKINLAAAKAGTPLADARAKQINGPIDQQIAQLNYNKSLRQAALGALQNGGASAEAAIPILVTDPAQQKAAIDAYGKIKSINEVHQNARNTFEHLRTRPLGGSLSPADRASAINSVAGQIQSIESAKGNKVNMDEAANLANSFFPAPGDYDETIKNKARRLDAYFEPSKSESRSVLKAHLIPEPKLAPQLRQR